MPAAHARRDLPMHLTKLIIADRDIPLVERLANYFRARGSEVKTAYDAGGVLKLVHLETPDALVLGINLTCNNGVCVCELLSAERRFSYLPVLLMTDRPEDRMTHDCRDLQAYYVSKGETLDGRVESLLDELTVQPPLVIAD
jgi:DNA-binding response OmpR family regulator